LNILVGGTVHDTQTIENVTWALAGREGWVLG